MLQIERYLDAAMSAGFMVASMLFMKYGAASLAFLMLVASIGYLRLALNGKKD